MMTEKGRSDHYIELYLYLYLHLINYAEAPYQLLIWRKMRVEEWHIPVPSFGKLDGVHFAQGRK